MSHPAHLHWVLQREREREGQLIHQGHRLPGQAEPLGTEELGHTSHSAGPAPEAYIAVQRGRDRRERDRKERKRRLVEEKMVEKRRGAGGGGEEGQEAWA